MIFTKTIKKTYADFSGFFLFITAYIEFCSDRLRHSDKFFHDDKIFVVDQTGQHEEASKQTKPSYKYLEIYISPSGIVMWSVFFALILNLLYIFLNYINIHFVVDTRSAIRNNLLCLTLVNITLGAAALILYYLRLSLGKIFVEKLDSRTTSNMQPKYSDDYHLRFRSHSEISRNSLVPRNLNRFYAQTIIKLNLIEISKGRELDYYIVKVMLSLLTPVIYLYLLILFSAVVLSLSTCPDAKGTILILKNMFIILITLWLICSYNYGKRVKDYVSSLFDPRPEEIRILNQCELYHRSLGRFYPLPYVISELNVHPGHMLLKNYKNIMNIALAVFYTAMLAILKITF